MTGKCRYISVGVGKLLSVLLALLLVGMLAGCGSKESAADESGDESATNKSFVDISELQEENSDIFAWVRVPDTTIDYPVLHSLDGDDEFYKSHDYLRKENPNGAIYTEAANLTDMCDFNEVLHGSSPDDGTMFAPLEQFLDRQYFDEHQFIYVYLDGNALVYYIFAAYTRENTRLIAQYDFSYASGCQQFLDEIYGSKSMNKIVRSGWENQVQPENFLITLSTTDRNTGKQLIVVGCMVGDVAGKIDRVMDYGDPEEY
nr:class B sortase [uncultured Butyrivibrio sp.]